MFEHSDFSNRGIHIFKSVNDAVKWQAEHQIDTATKYIKPVKEYITCIKEFTKPPININMEDYLQFIHNSKDYVL